MSFGKGVLTVFGLIALYLVLANGAIFNTILQTTGGTALKGIAVLQGRSTLQAGVS